MKSAALCLGAVGIIGMALPVAGQTAAPAAGGLKTRPELTEYRETSRYDDVVAFMQAAAKAAPQIHLTSFGKTFEGRSLPLAVIGAPDATPDSVRRTGKLRVYIQGNIHGGEVEGKESAQILLREIAEGRHADWLKNVVLLVAPIYNADGNEKMGPNTRGRQNGPIAGQGQRPNAQNYDLNRDHMKLDSPEARAFVKLMNDYDPHVAMDLHTTNGTYHAYHLTYAPPLNPATDPAIVDVLRKDWLPAVTRAIRTKYGWDYYYYGNVDGRDQTERAWRSFDHRPRFNNSYVGLRNRVAILSEAYAYASFEDRIKATSRFVEEVLSYASVQAAAIRKLTEDADRRAIVGSRLGLRAELERGGEVEILMGEVAQEKNPISGNVMNVRLDVKKPEKMVEYGTFKATETERVPATYYVPADARGAIDRLRAHGITMTPLARARKAQVEEYRIDGSEVAPREFQGHKERTIKGAWVDAERELPAGTLSVDMKQPLARLAFYLLEPRSDDGLLDWNVLDEVLPPDGKVYPVVRSRN